MRHKQTLADILGTGLGVCLLMNALVLGFTLPFLLIPRTAHVRAGGWGLLIVAFGIYALIVGLPRSWDQWRSGSRVAGFLGLGLALTPMPIAYWLFQVCAQVKGYELAP